MSPGTHVWAGVQGQPGPGRRVISLDSAGGPEPRSAVRPRPSGREQTRLPTVTREGFVLGAPVITWAGRGHPQV